MRQNRQKRKLHRDNRGSGLIMVLIMVAFLSILTAILMVAAYGGYRMRLEDKQGKNNFYTAETVLDEINVGLQEEVSKALAKAYQEVMVNYSLYETPAKRSEKFYEIYYKELQKALQKDELHTSQYDPATLRGYLSEELYGDGRPSEGVAADGSRANFGTYGTIIESVYDHTPDAENPDDGIYTLALKADGIVLKDLKVTYVNEQGYVSIITTDIRLALPAINFSQSATFPNLNQFSLIADEGLHAGNTKAAGSIFVYGNVYAKSMQLGAQTVNGKNLLSGTEIAFEKPWDGTGALSEDLSLVVCKENMQVASGKLVTDGSALWSRDIVLDSAELSLDGETYVQNDLKLNGLGSSAALKGTYTGFGTSAEDNNQSSAILINGRESSLDLSGLSSLNIGGHSFVATSGAGRNGSVHDADDVVEDILMGESVAVKSNQLIYLVPPEALGCEKLSDGFVGESAFRSNPMKIEQYQEIKNHPDKYVLLDAKRSIEALDGKSLSDYMKKQAIAGGGEEYRPIVIVKPTNAGSLVYCFMQFKDEEAANRYFRDYYKVNAQEVDKYTRIYADAIKMPDTEDATLYLHLAGNVLTYEPGAEATVTNATDGYGERKRAQELGVIREETFRALTTKMVSDMTQLSVEEQNKTVFHNIINKDAVKTMIHHFKEEALTDKAVLTTEDGSMAVLFCEGDYTIDNTTLDNIRMVVALGNVEIDKDFRGLVMAEGTITVCDKADVDGKVELKSLSLEEFTELLKIKRLYASESKDYYVLSIFWDGASYAYHTGVGMDYGTKEVSIEDLIVYERWSKK